MSVSDARLFGSNLFRFFQLNQRENREPANL